MTLLCFALDNYSFCEHFTIQSHYVAELSVFLFVFDIDKASERKINSCAFDLRLLIESPENIFLHQPSMSYANIAREGKSTSFGNLNIRDIYIDLMNDESNNSSSTEITPPQLSTNSAEMQNFSNSLENSTSDSLGLTES